MHPRRWNRLFLFSSLGLIGFLLAFTVAVDPFNVTPWNLLGIEHKVVKNDRVEKVARLRAAPRYDNLLLGSSRVYLINTETVNRHLGGRTYNAGVGTARPEDLLGFLILLEREGKFPSNVIVGLDFYTFNQALESNAYFLANKDLNFLSYRSPAASQLDKFLSPEALSASWRVLTTHFGGKRMNPTFEADGTKWGGSKVTAALPPPPWETRIFPEQTIAAEVNFVRSGGYPALSTERLGYVERIREICAQHDARLHAFITPLNGQLLDAITADPQLGARFREWKQALAERLPVIDFATHGRINDNAFFFDNPTHVTVPTGNLIVARLFGNQEYAWLSDFGVPLQGTSNESLIAKAAKRQ